MESFLSIRSICNILKILGLLFQNVKKISTANPLSTVICSLTIRLWIFFYLRII